MKEGMSTGRPKHDYPPPQELPIYEPSEARERVAELLAGGVRPLITVPLEYAEKFSREGLHILEHTDWASGEDRSVIAGTIGATPFLQENEDRAIFEVDPAQVQMAPRFTGPDKAFHGVVVFERGIPPQALKLQGTSRGTENKKEPPREGEAQVSMH